MGDVGKISRALLFNDYEKARKIVSQDKTVLYNVKLKNIKKLFWQAINKNDSLMVRYLFPHLEVDDRIEAIAYTYNSYIEREYYKELVADYFEEFFAASVTYSLSEYISILIDYVKDHKDFDSEKVDILVDCILDKKENPYAKKFAGKFNLFDLESFEKEIMNDFDEKKKEYETFDDNGTTFVCTDEWRVYTEEEKEEKKKKEQEEVKKRRREAVLKTVNSILKDVKESKKKNDSSKNKADVKKEDEKKEVSWREKLEDFKKRQEKQNEKKKRPEEKVSEKRKIKIDLTNFREKKQTWQEESKKKKEEKTKEKAKINTNRSTIRKQKTLARKLWWEKHKRELDKWWQEAKKKLSMAYKKGLDNWQKFRVKQKEKMAIFLKKRSKDFKHFRENLKYFSSTIKRLFRKKIFTEKNFKKDVNIEEFIENISNGKIKFGDLNEFKKRKVIWYALTRKNIDFLIKYFDELSTDEKRKTILLVYEEDKDRGQFINKCLKDYFRLFTYTTINENLYKFMPIIAKEAYHHANYESELNALRDYLAKCEVNNDTYGVMKYDYVINRNIILNIVKSDYIIDYVKTIKNEKDLRFVLEKYINNNSSKKEFRKLLETRDLGEILYNILDNCSLKVLEVSGLVLEILDYYEARARMGMQDNEVLVEKYIDALIYLNVRDDVRKLFGKLNCETRNEICSKFATCNADEKVLDIWMTLALFGNCKGAAFLLILLVNKCDKEMAAEMLRVAPKNLAAYVAENLCYSNRFGHIYVMRELDSLKATNPVNCLEIVNMLIEKMYFYYKKEELENMKVLREDLQKSVGNERKIKI